MRHEKKTNCTFILTDTNYIPPPLDHHIVKKTMYENVLIGKEPETIVFYIIISMQVLCSLLIFPTLIPLSGVGTTCFLKCCDNPHKSSCCDKDSAIIVTTGRLSDVFVL
jgi:hypothetical protein